MTKRSDQKTPIGRQLTEKTCKRIKDIADKYGLSAQGLCRALFGDNRLYDDLIAYRRSLSLLALDHANEALDRASKGDFQKVSLTGYKRVKKTRKAA